MARKRLVMVLKVAIQTWQLGALLERSRLVRCVSRSLIDNHDSDRREHGCCGVNIAESLSSVAFSSARFYSISGGWQSRFLNKLEYRHLQAAVA